MKQATFGPIILYLAILKEEVPLSATPFLMLNTIQMMIFRSTC